MHAAICEQTAKVELASPAARILHGLSQDRVRIDVTFLDHEIDLGDVHVHHASGADVEVPDLAVAHLTIRQTYGKAARADQRVGKLFQQAIVDRLACK